MIDNDLYILFGTTSRTYVCNIYKINLKTLKSEKLFDSVQMTENESYYGLMALNEEYPNEFLKGLYRQEVVHYKNKFYVFGGGNAEGNAYPFDLVYFANQLLQFYYINLIFFSRFKVTCIRFRYIQMAVCFNSV